MNAMARPSLYISLLSIALSFSGGFQQGYITSALNPPYVYFESFINVTFTERVQYGLFSMSYSRLLQLLANFLQFGCASDSVEKLFAVLDRDDSIFPVIYMQEFRDDIYRPLLVVARFWDEPSKLYSVDYRVCAKDNKRSDGGNARALYSAIQWPFLYQRILSGLGYEAVCQLLSDSLSNDLIFATDIPIVIIAIILFVILPDSPVSILERTGNIDQARAILAKYHGVSFSAPEINQHLNMDRKLTEDKWSEATPGILWIFNPCGAKDNRLRVIQQAVWIGVTVKMVYVFSGAQTLRAYSSFFLHDMDHYSLSGANLGSWIISGLRILFGLIPVLRFSRRLLMNSSMVVTVMGLTAVVVGILILSAIAFAAVILASAGGVGSMSRFYSGELVPRSILLSSTSILAIIEVDSTRIIVKFVWFPVANDVGAYSMLIFLIPSAVLLIIIWMMCPETSNRTVPQVLDEIALRKKLTVEFNE
ncbi:hypothetical protein PRIPAC_81463 [Pristionchus pacificus]|uniref:Uncharacterized protein n=1 Tax=Pristionchus pacificus TaxID=54126 RepID=A0A2A6C337_PRIPA|nr:hypothetical protein PRIPAC_81463 [Pristionchus pacificus]|eukprot:PDM72443.1 hypothetical protein PRIPAC_38877 [Pristionchus pacificus]